MGSATRIAATGLLAATAVGVWWVPVAHTIADACRSLHDRRTIAILYTTDTRGFLEGCG